MAVGIGPRDVDRTPRVGARLETGMLGLDQGIVSNPAALFGGVKVAIAAG
jgi:succinate-semialdehyde dehydrogenase/glutarate-semialdehyde dehydrogenase